jgi:hypothetical protein
MKKVDYDGYRFPPAIIQQAISYDLVQGRGRARYTPGIVRW